MKQLIALSFTLVFLLGAVACHKGGSNSNLGTNPGGMFGDDDPLTEVTICHVPEGLLAGPYTMIIASSELEAHLAHGDTDGECVTDGPPLDDDGRTDDGGTDDPADGDDDDDDSDGGTDGGTDDPADGDDDDDDSDGGNDGRTYDPADGDDDDDDDDDDR